MARVFISDSSRDNEAADKIKKWLTEQGFDTPFLEFDKYAGIPPGSDWERTLYREIDCSEALVIIQTPNWLESKWCFAEFTQARAPGKPIFPVISTPVGKTLISPDIQALDLTEVGEGGLEQQSAQLSQIAINAQGGLRASGSKRRWCMKAPAMQKPKTRLRCWLSRCRSWRPAASNWIACNGRRPVANPPGR